MSKIFLVSDKDNPEILEELSPFIKKDNLVKEPEKADIFISVGGDGRLLGAVRHFKDFDKPFFGLHLKADDYSDGFLLNPFTEEVLKDFCEQKIYTEEVSLLKVAMFNEAGENFDTQYAFGDCYFKDYLGGIIHTRLSINDKVKFKSIDSDGILVCTSAGSTAYNASARGVILPLDSHDMVVTAICPKPLYRWHSTILSRRETVELEPLNTGRRPAKFWLDGEVVEGVAKVRVSQSDRKVKLAFANSYDFRQKVLNLQFGD